MTWTHLGLERFRYQKGLHDLGNGAYAWLQPDGGWGWSNAGLLVDGGEALLVDTLFDLAHTRDMLAAMRAAEPEATRAIGTLVNTHANGDHCFGNELVGARTILSSKAAAAEMAEAPPARLAQLMTLARSQDTPLGHFLLECFSAFDFEGITLTPPTAPSRGAPRSRSAARPSS